MKLDPATLNGADLLDRAANLTTIQGRTLADTIDTGLDGDARATAWGTLTRLLAMAGIEGAWHWDRHATPAERAAAATVAAVLIRWIVTGQDPAATATKTGGGAW